MENKKKSMQSLETMPYLRFFKAEAICGAAAQDCKRDKLCVRY